ncbi:MAG: AI-2E family transporter [Victivallales bacterium]|nr:AI-2E family transporter [Victivallales bacterium]
MSAQKVSQIDTVKDADTSKSNNNFIVSLAAFVVIVAGMKLAQTIIVPVLLAAFIAIISAPAIFWLQTKKVPKWGAFLIVVAVVMLVMTFFGYIISSSVGDFMSKLPKYQTQLEKLTETTLDFAEKHRFPVPKGNIRETLFEQVSPAMLLGFSGTMIGGLGGLLSNLLLIIVTVVFMLLEYSSFPRKIQSLKLLSEDSKDSMRRFTKVINDYLALKTIISLATGIIVTTMLFIFKVDYAPLWGLIAFFLNYVPNIGSIIAAIPAVLLSLIQLGWETAVAVALGYLVINITIGSIVEPRYMGKGLGLSPLVIFLSLIFWGWILGPVGMFLSVPLTMTAKIACDSNARTRWIGVFLGP